MKTIEVQIFNQTYLVKGGDDAEHIRRAAQFVDEKMREIASASRERMPDRMALLAALNIADELFRLRADHDRRDEAQVDAAQRLIEQIETELKALPLK